MNVLAPALLASQVLDQNRRLIRQKKKSQAIGFPAPFRQQLAMGNTTEVDYMDIDHDYDDPSTHDSPMMMEDHDEVYGQSKVHRSGRIMPHVEHGKSF
jgi:hypothetical protein